ncbi:DUF4919 domain-containing protein [Wenyingzhuangia sp. IMCC45467]
MKKVFFLTTFIISFSIFAQELDFEKPNYKLIKSEIENINSDLYYPKLLEKYYQSDSTMTLEHKRHLYYGYIFNKNYSPYTRSENISKARDIYKKKNITKNDLEKIIEYGQKAIKEFPFDFSALNYLVYANNELNNKDESEKLIRMYNIIIDAIYSSGVGIEKENAIYVINTSHEYEMLYVFGYEFGGRQSLIEHFDYLEIKENENNLDGLFFDISPALNSLNFNKQ